MNAEIVIVTGGGRGIGRAIVERYQSIGAHVATCGRGPKPADLADDVLWVSADVSRARDSELLVEATRRRFGIPTILVNNAGVQLEKTVLETTDDDWDLVMGVNAKGVFNMCRSVLAEMHENGGKIVNIGSISGMTSDPSLAVYNASKAFVHGLTRSIAVDHGPSVRCNAVCPGWVMTAMADKAFALAKDPLRARSDALARHAVGRFGAPEDVARAVTWLTSDEAAFVTGQCIVVDGGLMSGSPLRPQLF